MAGNTRPVVVGVDFLPEGDAAIVNALQRAAQAEELVLHFVHAAQPNDLAEEFGEEEFDSDEEVLERAVQLVRARVDKVASARSLRVEPSRMFMRAIIGKPTRALVRACEEHGAELLIVGTHARRGLEKFVNGSVAEALIRHAPCPVLVARAKSESAYGERQAIREK